MQKSVALKSAVVVGGLYSLAIAACGAQGETGGGAGRYNGGSSGSPSTGGTFGTGGTPGGAGVVGTTGGAPPATGGSAGSFGVGGSVGSAGSFGVGGSAAGSVGAGGSGTLATCDAAFTVGDDGFVKAPGLACWQGYAYAGGDTGSTVTPISFATCGPGCMLHTAGTLGVANAANAYAGVVYLGFNIAQPPGSSATPTMVPTGTSLVVTYTKTSGPDIRVQVSDGTTRWCAPLTASPETIAFTSFNTMCWDGTGTAYAKQPIRDVLLIAPGAEAAVPVDITLVSIKEQ